MLRQLQTSRQAAPDGFHPLPARANSPFPAMHAGNSGFSGASFNFAHVPVSNMPLCDGIPGTDAGTSATPTGGDAGTPAAPTFPTFTQITGNSTVKTAMDNAWGETKRAANATGRREQGFWIKWNSTADSYDLSTTFVGPTVGPDETGAADPGTKPGDASPVFTVGLFHTHTPMTFRTGGTRDVGPSGPDNRFHTSNNVAGVVYDYVESPAGSGSIPAGHPLDSAAQLYSSGPARRT